MPVFAHSYAHYFPKLLSYLGSLLFGIFYIQSISVCCNTFIAAIYGYIPHIFNGIYVINWGSNELWLMTLSPTAEDQFNTVPATGGLFIAIVGTFRSKTTCDVLEKLLHCNEGFVKIHRSKIDYFVTVTAMNFCKYCDDVMTFFYKKNKIKIIFFIAVIAESVKV